MTNVGIILKKRRLVNILFRFFAEIRSLRLDDQVDELILDENDLDDLHPVERLGDLLDLTGSLDDGILLAVHRHGDGALLLRIKYRHNRPANLPDRELHIPFLHHGGKRHALDVDILLEIRYTANIAISVQFNGHREAHCLKQRSGAFLIQEKHIAGF